MSDKQDRTYTRTAAQLEQKHNFGKTFAQIIGLVEDTRDHVDSVESTLQSEFNEQTSTIRRDLTSIGNEVSEKYQKIEGDMITLEEELRTTLEVTADGVKVDVRRYTDENVQDVDGVIRSEIESREKFFNFGTNGLVIQSTKADGSVNEIKLLVDNSGIGFYKGEIDESDLTKNRFGFWDGENFYTGNIVVDVDERAQFGNFAFVPRRNGSLSFLKVRD